MTTPLLRRLYTEIDHLPHQEQYDLILMLRQIADRLEERLSLTLVADVRVGDQRTGASR